MEVMGCLTISGLRHFTVLTVRFTQTLLTVWSTSTTLTSWMTSLAFAWPRLSNFVTYLDLKGLWASIEILSDKNLSDKGKYIYSLVIFLSQEKQYC